MRRFNLSEWALTNRSLVLFAMILLGIIGAWSYRHLGQSEDPPFTFKAMVVRTVWPGATADEVAQQVTERIEKAVMTTGNYEYIRSYSRPGESQVIFAARDSLRSRDMPQLWYQVRKKVGDIRATLPAGVVGPFFNDEFGDTFGNIYALTGEGFDYAVMKDYADRIQLELQRVDDVGKVELVGLQDEKVWIELSNTKLATLGIPLNAVQQALEEQNAVTPAGFFETASDRVQLRVSGEFTSVDEIREFPIRAGGRTVKLGDIAQIKRGFADPAAPRMRFMGQPGIGIAVAMKDGGDILKLGSTLEAEFHRLQKTLPLGMELRKVSDQPAAVKAGVGEFVQVLVEALVIVLLVSFFSLGLRTGLVVALAIPLVLAMTFLVMYYANVGLHKISLGALIIALGLLVDDAIIVVEAVSTHLEAGWTRTRAAISAYTADALSSGGDPRDPAIGLQAQVAPGVHAERGQLVHLLGVLGLFQARMYLLAGRLDEAVSAYTDLAARMAENGAANGAKLAMVGRVTGEFCLGDLGTLADELVFFYREISVAALDAAVLALFARGREAEARALWPDRKPIERAYFWVPFTVLRVNAAVAMGDLDEVRARATELERYSGSIAGLGVDGLMVGPVDDALAAAAEALDRPDDARRYRKAAETLRARLAAEARSFID